MYLTYSWKGCLVMGEGGVRWTTGNRADDGESELKNEANSAARKVRNKANMKEAAAVGGALSANASARAEGKVKNEAKWRMGAMRLRVAQM
jgi:hypothetical protein